MHDERAKNPFPSNWILIGVGWLAFALFFASELIVTRFYAGRPLNVEGALFNWLICGGLWFAGTPLILWLARRFPIDRQRWLASVFVHLAASALLSFLMLGVFTFISLQFGHIDAAPWPRAFRAQLVASIYAEVLTYWIVIGLSQGIDYYRKYRERELRASQLEARLAQAQLDALRMQLHPHFLFNTLNSISVLMSDDVAAARRMLTRLSELLRVTLDNVGTHEVSLREELEFLNNYLEIEQTRFQDRLSVRMQIEPEVLNARVPNLILQPLVENAIRHGIAPRAQPGWVEIRASRENGIVKLQVRDNGPGLNSDSSKPLVKGVGLTNTEARLEQLYGGNHNFEISDIIGGGLQVAIAIPFRNGSAMAE
jgi:two-component system, LytTR family, sensor kinase